MSATRGGVVERVREQVRSGGLLGGQEPVVVMLSGGQDSVCLLDVAVSVCGAERVWALHVNYGLRPQAAAEERHCRDLCEALGVPIELRSAERDGAGGAGAAGDAGATGAAGNLHAWARELRYRAAEELAGRLDGERALVASGHTASDQAETILYRLAASPGRRALLGMAARDGRLVRPLLGVTREQTAAYCDERSLRFCEDLSNDDPRYARARVRHGLLQALLAVHPAALGNVLRTAELLREETELLDGLVESELQGHAAIAVERLRSLPRALARLIAIRLAEQAAGGLVPQAGERVEEILALAGRGGRAQLHVGGLASAIVQDGELRMVKIAPRPQHPPRKAPARGGQ